MKNLAYLVPVLALASPVAAFAQDSSMATGGAVATEAGAGRYVVLFGFDSASLDPEAQGVLAEAAEEYRRTGQARVGVQGYADTSGDAAYNRRLSDRRAGAVTQELVSQGVPASAIEAVALGEDDPAVPTGDDVAEAGNRRVVVEVEQPAPAPVAAVTSAIPAVIAGDESSPWRLNLGGFYGYNMEDSGNDARDSHLAGLNLSADRSLNDYLNLSLEQAGFYNFASENDGFGGRSVLGIDFTFGTEKSIPYIPIAVGYIGANLGGIYGSGIEDSFLAGPEVGVKLGPLDAKLAYDIPFNRSWEQGVVAATVGFGIRF